MRKEVLIAIVIGAVLGAAVAFGIWRANIALTPEEDPTKTEANPTNGQEEISIQQLIVTQPEDGLIVAEDIVILKGSAQPAALIAILTNSGEIIVEAGKDGSFEQEVELEGGANEITITAYDADGTESTQTITVVYSTEFPGE